MSGCTRCGLPRKGGQKWGIQDVAPKPQTINLCASCHKDIIAWFKVWLQTPPMDSPMYKHLKRFAKRGEAA